MFAAKTSHHAVALRYLPVFIGIINTLGIIISVCLRICRHMILSIHVSYVYILSRDRIKLLLMCYVILKQTVPHQQVYIWL